MSRFILSAVSAAALLVGGCAKDANVEFAMVDGTRGQSVMQFTPQRIEVRHAELGWITVPTEVADADMQEFGQGRRVSLAVADLPKGKYESLRISFLAPMGTLTPVVEPVAETPVAPAEDNILTAGELRHGGESMSEEIAASEGTAPGTSYPDEEMNPAQGSGDAPAYDAVTAQAPQSGETYDATGYLVENDVKIHTEFCVDGKGDDEAVVLAVWPAHPLHLDRGPNVIVKNLPACTGGSSVDDVYGADAYDIDRKSVR